MKKLALLALLAFSGVALGQTTLYLRDVPVNNLVIGTDLVKSLDPVRGSVSVSLTTNVIDGPVTPPTAATQISLGSNHGITWVSAPVQAFTLSGDVTINIRGRETSGTGNAALEMRIVRISSAGAIVSDVVAAPPSPIPAELTTSDAAYNTTVAAVSTAFSTGDRIGVQLYMDDADGVTMSSIGSAQIRTSYDGPTAGATGDAFITFTESLSFPCAGCYYGPWPPGPPANCEPCCRYCQWPPGPEPTS